MDDLDPETRKLIERIYPRRRWWGTFRYVWLDWLLGTIAIVGWLAMGWLAMHYCPAAAQRSFADLTRTIEIGNRHPVYDRTFFNRNKRLLTCARSLTTSPAGCCVD